MLLKYINAITSHTLGLYGILLVVFAFNLSSHTFAFWPGDNWWLRSVYWLSYLLLALSFIFGIYYLLEKLKTSCSNKILFLLAIVISWLPFGLAISMIDIATSRPATSYAIRELQNTGFMVTLLLNMAVNILPKHLMFGMLIYCIHFYVSVHRNEKETCNPIPKTENFQPISESTAEIETAKMNSDKQATVMQAAVVKKLSHGVRAEPQRLQAQEHYLSVTTALGQELILYKLSQAIKDIPHDYGLQVHRSFWVAKKNIRGWSMIDNSMKVILHYGDPAPVSRRFEHRIKQDFEKISQ